MPSARRRRFYPVLEHLEDRVLMAVLVEDIRTGPLGSDPANLIALGNTLVFSANDGTSGKEPWSWSAATGKQAMNIAPDGNVAGGRSSSPFGFTKINDKVVFFAWDFGATPSHGFELYSTDGTTASRLADLNQAPVPNAGNVNGDAVNPDTFKGFTELSIDGKLYFSATRSIGPAHTTTTSTLYWTDGNQVQMVNTADITPATMIIIESQSQLHIE